MHVTKLFFNSIFQSHVLVELIAIYIFQYMICHPDQYTPSVMETNCYIQSDVAFHRAHTVNVAEIYTTMDQNGSRWLFASMLSIDIVDVRVNIINICITSSIFCAVIYDMYRKMELQSSKLSIKSFGKKIYLNRYLRRYIPIILCLVVSSYWG